MKANSLVCEQNHRNIDTKYLSEEMCLMQTEWAENIQKFGEQHMRDTILRSICPEVHGMYPVKLAVALAICSGNNDCSDNSNLHHRGQSHVLMIGKTSKLQLFFSFIIIR